MPFSVHRSILALTGKSQRQSARCALRLAQAAGVQVKLVSLVPGLPGSIQIGAPEILALSFHMRRSEAQYLGSQVRRGAALGVEVQTAILQGPPEEALLDELREPGHGLLLLDAGAPAAGPGLDVGSLVRNSPVPVWLVRSGRLSKSPLVLVAVTGSWEDPLHAELDSAAVRMGSRICHWLGGSLHVVHAWQAPGESMMSDSIFLRVSEEERRHHLDRVHRQHEESVRAILAAAGVPDGSAAIHIEKGDPQFVIPAACHAYHADLVVMGTACRTGIANWLVGNTLDKVLADLPCSVLAVRTSQYLPIPADREEVGRMQTA